MAGALEPPARMAQRVAAGLGRSDDAMMFAGGRASAAGAAFANGVASHILELDDIHKGSTVHAAAPIIPAALAVAEREHATGRAFLTAVALGYEAAFRIGEAVNPSHYRFWHPTGTVATFGAAVAAGSLMRLDADQMLHALGSAGTQAAGLWEFNADGSMSKHLHPGQGGVQRRAVGRPRACRLHRRGADPRRRSRVLPRDEHRRRSRARDRRPGHDLEDRRERLQAVFVLRPYAHRDRRRARPARRRGWSAEQALRARSPPIDIETYGPGYEIVKEMNPRSPYQAKFSLAYCVAVGTARRGVGLAQFAPERFGPDGVRVPADRRAAGTDARHASSTRSRADIRRRGRRA